MVNHISLIMAHYSMYRAQTVYTEVWIFPLTPIILTSSWSGLSYNFLHSCGCKTIAVAMASKFLTPEAVFTFPRGWARPTPYPVEFKHNSLPFRSGPTQTAQGMVSSEATWRAHKQELGMWENEQRPLHRRKKIWGIEFHLHVTWQKYFFFIIFYLWICVCLYGFMSTSCVQEPSEARKRTQTLEQELQGSWTGSAVSTLDPWDTSPDRPFVFSGDTMAISVPHHSNLLFLFLRCTFHFPSCLHRGLACPCLPL